MNEALANHPRLPWWRVRMMWLVLLGPALVVVASFITLALAVRGGDAPLRKDPGTDAKARADAMAPAHRARNHAAAATR